MINIVLMEDFGGKVVLKNLKVQDIGRTGGVLWQVFMDRKVY